MTNLFLQVLAILATIVCWGSYGPLLHWGKEAMGHGNLRPFICVGIAYFLIAVIVPIVMLSMGFDEGARWRPTGVMWSLAAGTAGALGALGIILAFAFQGRPIYVMPLVFGGAPVINTMITISAYGQWRQVNPFFYAGLLMVGVGAVTVLVSKPKPPKTTVRTAAMRVEPGTEAAGPVGPGGRLAESGPSRSESGPAPSAKKDIPPSTDSSA